MGDRLVNLEPIHSAGEKVDLDLKDLEELS